MSVAAKLEQIEKAFNESEQEDRSTAIDALVALHMEVIKGKKDADLFFEQAAGICGGIYIPYLFWIELSKYANGKGDYSRAVKLIQAFTDSDFDAELQQQMKALLVVYLAKETEFNRDKVKAHIVDKAHPTVREYFTKIYNFIENNQRVAATYNQKFALVKDYFPNFDLYNLPLAKLEAQLAGA